MQRCETEVDKLMCDRLYSPSSNGYEKHFQTTETESSQSKYEEEARKHEMTKRALDKAIQLANLLLDECTINNKGTTSGFGTVGGSFVGKMEEASANPNCSNTLNSRASFAQSCKYQTVEYPFASNFNNSYKQSLVIQPTNYESFAETVTHNLNMTKSSIERSGRNKTPKKELADLTNLIRKNRVSPKMLNQRLIKDNI